METKSCLHELCTINAAAKQRMQPGTPPQVAFLVRDVWRGVSSRSLYQRGEVASRRGAARDLAGLVLTRWDAGQPARLDNLVLMMQEDADAHDAQGVVVARQQDPRFAAFVERTLEDAAAWFFGAGDAARLPLRA